MSTVIKAGQGGTVLGRLSTVDLADHLAEARAVVDEAKQEAARIVAQAEEHTRRTLEETGKAGFQAGYEQGHTEGAAAGRQAALHEALERFSAEHADVVSAMNRAVAEIDAVKKDLSIAAERDLLEFAVLVAGRLTFAIGRLHREAAQAGLHQALRLVESKTDLTIQVHPDDRASIETFAGSVLQQMDASRAVNLEVDDTLAPGGCRVRSGGTEIDAALETKVDEMVALLLGGTMEDG